MLHCHSMIRSHFSSSTLLYIICIAIVWHRHMAQRSPTLSRPRREANYKRPTRPPWKKTQRRRTQPDIEEQPEIVKHRALAAATQKRRPLLRASAKRASKQRAESSNAWQKVFRCHGSAEDGQGRAWPTKQAATKKTNKAADIASQNLEKLVESGGEKVTTPTAKAATVRETKRLPLVSAASRPSHNKRKTELVEMTKDYREEANLLKHGRTLVDPGNRNHYVVIPRETFSAWIDNVLSTPDAIRTAMQRALNGTNTCHPRKDTGS
jgi:hypothetical protein